MRSCSWLLICWWVLQLSLSLGVGLTTVSAASSTIAAAHTAHAPQADAADPSTATPLDECHGHASAQTETHHDDSVHCSAQADCHHCCPLGWGSGTGMAGHAAPNIQPAGPMSDWRSASWLPNLRPPIA